MNIKDDLITLAFLSIFSVGMIAIAGLSVAYLHPQPENNLGKVGRNVITAADMGLPELPVQAIKATPVRTGKRP